MGHLTRKEPHRILREQLDRFPMGAPGNTVVMDILETIFTTAEAQLAASMPLGFSKLEELSTKLNEAPEVLKVKLDVMADKGLVLDLEIGGQTKYCLPPTLVGLFEFSMMRIRDDFDQKELAGLFSRYLVEEPEYFLQIENNTTTPFRTLVHEETIPSDYSEVLDYERATKIIAGEDLVAVGICHCRHVAHHLDRDCRLFTMESCLSFGSIADYLIRHNFAERIEQDQALDIVAEAKSKGMVHIGDNVQKEPNFMCNCCTCCCEVLNSFRNFDFFSNTFSSNFEARVSQRDCTGCKKCFKACPVEAIDMIEAAGSQDKNEQNARVNKDVCIGCGVCIPGCKNGSILMRPRPQRNITPENTIARTLMMAIEKGTLSDLLVDRHSSMTSAAIGLLIGAITKLPPGKQLLARESFKSRFVDFLMSKSK